MEAAAAPWDDRARVEIVDRTARDATVLRGREDLNALSPRLAPPASARYVEAATCARRAGRIGTIVDGRRPLAAGTLAIVPRGSTRSVVAGPDGLRCLTVHRRRGGLAMADFRGAGVGLHLDT
jgi:hypothetical protein